MKLWPLGIVLTWFLDCSMLTTKAEAKEKGKQSVSTSAQMIRVKGWGTEGHSIEKTG